MTRREPQCIAVGNAESASEKPPTLTYRQNPISNPAYEVAPRFGTTRQSTAR